MAKQRSRRPPKTGAPFTYPLHAELETVNQVREGLPFNAIDYLLETNTISQDELTELFIPSRTLYRRKQENRLSPAESDTVTRVRRIAEFAENVFGEKERSANWLRRANRTLEGRTPIELLNTEVGARIVEALLGRIQSGVYS